MNNIKVEEFLIKTSHGNIYAKKWIPEKINNQGPVVLIHDSLGCVNLWRDFPELLATKLSRCVIAYDRLGFGKSDVCNGSLGFDFIEYEANIFLSCVKPQLSISDYILWGHSVGGAMAINIAAVDIDCEAVITEAAQAFVEEITILGIKSAKREFLKKGQIEKLEKWHGNKADWVLRAWTDTWLSPEFSQWSLAPCLNKVNCPVLVLHGDKDEFGSKAFPEFIADNVKGKSTMVMLDGCGHVPHKEKISEVLQSVLLFCE